MRWVSIKVLRADATKDSRELGILQSLAAYSPEDNCKYVVQLLDAFLHVGPNGTHQCLVFELLGPTLEFVVRDYRGHYSVPDILEPEIIYKLSEQLLRGIAFLHEAGFTHGGKCRKYMIVVPDVHAT